MFYIECILIALLAFVVLGPTEFARLMFSVGDLIRRLRDGAQQLYDAAETLTEQQTPANLPQWHDQETHRLPKPPLPQSLPCITSHIITDDSSSTIVGAYTPVNFAGQQASAQQNNNTDHPVIKSDTDHGRSASAYHGAMAPCPTMPAQTALWQIPEAPPTKNATDNTPAKD